MSLVLLLLGHPLCVSLDALTVMKFVCVSQPTLCIFITDTGNVAIIMPFGVFKMYRYVIIFHWLFSCFADFPRSQIRGNCFIASHPQLDQAHLCFVVLDIEGVLIFPQNEAAVDVCVTRLA